MYIHLYGGCDRENVFLQFLEMQSKEFLQK